jgi:hypothetical protein
VGKLLALDRVKIEGALFTLDNPYIAEKEISPRLKLNFRGTVSGMTEQKVSFDYLLGGNFFLTTETNQNGKTNFDLRYVIKFK